MYRVKPTPDRSPLTAHNSPFPLYSNHPLLAYINTLSLFNDPELQTAIIKLAQLIVFFDQQTNLATGLFLPSALHAIKTP
jgi:hypothetical protein